jgi:hypothetical protein
VSLSRVAYDTRCEGFSGADLANLVREAAISALREAQTKVRLQEMEAIAKAKASGEHKEGASNLSLTTYDKNSKRSAPIDVKVSWCHFDTAFGKVSHLHLALLLSYPLLYHLVVPVPVGSTFCDREATPRLRRSGGTSRLVPVYSDDRKQDLARSCTSRRSRQR